eukprot:CAMPEP_0178963710 /NCGR_PEP_ID=MMETSP0789-20121207/15194_1 /TAXON_ID=3005 /ORGANISM="Rhizosolenia setigera, Strain CCMP 1694" /LENGTH=364 /DNA_ID=CAMNT_0020648247 /DNA_START=139 /DNA_END=1233 /DNA_ORIENTATION=-
MTSNLRTSATNDRKNNEVESTSDTKASKKEVNNVKESEEDRYKNAAKQLFCGGVAGSVSKTVTAPFSRLTILYQVHSMVTTKENRPRFAMSFTSGFKKIVQRGGFISLWKGNGTSVLHRFPFSGINFYCYENMLDLLNGRHRFHEDEDGHSTPPSAANIDSPAWTKFISGAVAGSTACICCYPLDLVRTRLTTELPGKENYKGISDAFFKIMRAEGIMGFYSGIGPTLCVAVPSFAISYSVYGSLKEYVLDDELFYNLRKIDDESGEVKLGLRATLLCGAGSGTMATLATFPFDTVRRRMQIQNLHVPVEDRLTGYQQITQIATKEGLRGLYRGLTPELIKVVPMVGTMFLVYEQLKKHLNVGR